MFVVALVATSVLAGILSALIVDGARSYRSNLLYPHDRIEKLLTDLMDELTQLNRTLISIDIDPNDRCLSLSQLPSNWLEELEKCRYDIEDVTEHMQPVIQRKRVTKFLKTNIKTVRKIHMELRGRNQIQQTDPRGAIRTPYGAVPADEFVRLDDREEIIRELIMESDSSGVSITGIAGIGKTVLAEAAKVEAISNGHFSRGVVLRVPILSPEFNIESAVEGMAPLDNERILVLLDGMESVDMGVWLRLRSAVTEKFPGSKFIITTQNPHVADTTDTTRYCLHPLSEDQCFQIILHLAKKKTLTDRDEADIRNNEKELADLCKGLPLLANKIGLLLAAAPAGGRRRTILSLAPGLWKAPGLGRLLIDLEPISLLRQEPLLKRCLAYCTLFPRDHEFEQDDLVQFWNAEGFTQVSAATGDTTLDAAARKDFDRLFSCSIFQTSKGSCNEEASYKMQTLAYDLALYIASSTFCRKHIGNSFSTNTSLSEIQEDTRHFSLSSDKVLDDNQIIPQLLKSTQRKCRGLRTFLLFGEAGKNISENPTFFRTLTFLRVLDLSRTNLTKLEESHISDLKYLRYLDLSYTPLEKLPKLHKNLELQVLKLNCCGNLYILPDSITKLTNLVSLQVNTAKIPCMPPYIGKLSKLQTLNVFKVGTREGFKIAELKNLNGPQKSLHITQLEKVETNLEAQQAELHKKIYLDRLELEWSSSAAGEVAKQVFKGLKPPKNLKELIIRGYCPEFPEWLNGTEVYGVLETIHLDGCANLLRLPPLGHLRSLENLIISGCTNLEELPTLPAFLKRLVIKDSAISGYRQQANHPDWPEIDGVIVELDPQPGDADVLTPVAPDEQSRSFLDQRTANLYQLTSIHSQSSLTNNSRPLLQGSSSSVSSVRSHSKPWSLRFGLKGFKRLRFLK